MLRQVGRESLGALCTGEDGVANLEVLKLGQDTIQAEMSAVLISA